MKIIYRISDSGYDKVKPHYINNENCFLNALSTFPIDNHEWLVIADNVGEETKKMLENHVENIQYVSIGNGAETFNLALDEALKEPLSKVIYFLENDYLHKPNSDKIILEGLGLGFSFVSLYDHPDKYLSPSQGGNPYCEGGAENTRVYLTESTHWKITNSTTMTFAATVSTLIRTRETLRRHTQGNHPEDFKMFLDLGSQRELLLTPIPSYSTHGETRWLSPLTDWSKLI
jgi:hypothetical protein